MDDIKIISYTENTELIQGNKYIEEISGIQFVYDPEENKDKPYLLNNGYRLNHFPTKADKGTNNLTNMKDRTMEERQAIGSKGGNKSVMVQAQRRSFKDSLNMILSCKASKEEFESMPTEIQELFKSSGIIPTKEDLINIRAVELSIIGSDKHMVFTRDTVGEKPTDKTEVTADIITDSDRALLDKISKRILADRVENLENL